MAGTLTISTLSDGTNSTSSTNCIQGSAKAWVNFNGVTTATVRASYNVSSVTRTGTGTYTVSFTNAFADANYSYVFGGQPSQDTIYGVKTQYNVTNTASALYLTTGSATDAADGLTVNVACFR